MSMKEVAEGLTILAKYCDGGDGTMAAEYEEIHCDGPDEIDLSPEDRARLKELGWSLCEEEGWVVFV